MKPAWRAPCPWETRTKRSLLVKGSAMIHLKNISAMVDKLGQISDRFTRVSQEVSTKGKFGGQVVVVDAEVTRSWRES